MSQAVVKSAMLRCTGGTSPCSLIVISPPTLGEGKDIATITDNVPFKNIPGFSTCIITGKPLPCVPSFPAPWSGGSSTVLVHGIPALKFESKLQCAKGGTVSIISPGEATITLS